MSAAETAYLDEMRGAPFAAFRWSRATGSTCTGHPAAGAAHYGVCRHALGYLLRAAGVAPADCRLASLMLRQQMFRRHVPRVHRLALVRPADDPPPQRRMPGFDRGDVGGNL